MFNYPSRRARARIRMQEEGMDAMLLFLSSNLLYLLGWTDSPGERFLGALFTPEREAMVVPRLYAGEVATHTSVADLRIWEEQASPFELVVQMAREFGVARGRWAVDGNPDLCMTGHTFSVEPGVYFSGKFGLRLEDIVVVTEAGNEALADLPRDLVVLPA